MGRNGFWALSVLALSACGGTTTTSYAPGVYPSLSGSLSGRTLTSSRSAQTNTKPGGTSTDTVIHSQNVSLVFNSATQVSVTLTPPVGGTRTVVLNDIGGGLFSDGAPSPITLRYAASDTGAGTAANMLTFVLTDASGAGFMDRLVVGNRTTKLDMPKSGGATYTGKFDAYDGSGANTTARIVLNANFAAPLTTGVQGTIDQFSSSSLAGATFTFANAPISNGTFGSTLTVAGATSNGENLIDGAFFGPAAKEVGGTIIINTTQQAVGGVFAGTRP